MHIDVAAFEQLARALTQSTALVIDLVALLIIVYAALRAFVIFLHGVMQRKTAHSPLVETIRFELGRSLILALEFLIGSDILRTAVAPTWSIIGQLAAIVGLRTLLDYFLGIELRDIRQQEHNTNE